jgi:spore coat polysaccharide biosynthesis protein SpsF
VAIIQAHMASSRLPGKVLMDIAGRTMLARTVERTRRAKRLDEVVVAATTASADEAIVAECGRLEAPVFRGAEEDVLDRYRRAAVAHGAGAVVRVTSDCPLIDPGIIDRVVGAFLREKPDYASNSLRPAFPVGLGVSVARVEALERAWREARERYERVHVMPYLYRNPRRFRLLSVEGEEDLSGHRWTVDTGEDLEFVRAVYARLGGEGLFDWRDVLALLEREPALADINRHVRQKRIEEC